MPEDSFLELEPGQLFQGHSRSNPVWSQAFHKQIRSNPFCSIPVHALLAATQSDAIGWPQATLSCLGAELVNDADMPFRSGPFQKRPFHYVPEQFPFRVFTLRSAMSAVPFLKFSGNATTGTFRRVRSVHCYFLYCTHTRFDQ